MENKKAPIPLQILAVLLCLGGTLAIILGFPLLLVFGFGIIPIVLGTLAIKYALDIFKLKRRGYNGIMVISGISLFLMISNAISIGFGNISNARLSQFFYFGAIMGILFYFRNQFSD